jgi:uncharacterized Zn finger protein (UPF0148 family)
MQQRYQCPQCGAPVAFGVRFCSNCGTALSWPAQQTSKSKKTDNEAEQIEYLNTLISIYQNLNPSLSSVAKLEDDLPPGPDILFQAYSNYQPVLQSIKMLHKAPHKELQRMTNNLQQALLMCIKAGKMSDKMIDDLRYNARLASRMHLASIVGYISYAKSYHEEFTRRMNQLYERLAP